MNRRAAGTKYEQLTKDYLRRQGCTILEENFRCSFGEIDLIILDGRYLVFVEVKFRSSDCKGMPEEAVTFYKQERIRKVALFYLHRKHYAETAPCRFDVVSILGGQVHWIKNAF